MTIPCHKVILVEEDPVEAEILEFYLNRTGVKSITVRTTEEALEHIDPTIPFGILTEASGAAIDWKQLAEATLGYPSIFMILSDAALTAEAEFEAMKHGVCEIFVKPVEPKAIVKYLQVAQPAPLGSRSVGLPEDSFGGDFRIHHAQKLLQFARRHGRNALIEVELGANFGGVLIKNGQPIDAWLEGFRGRSALNAILMLEEAPFVYFELDESAEELERPNIIDTGQGEPLDPSEPVSEESAKTEDRSESKVSNTPPPVPEGGRSRKKRRLYSKTDGFMHHPPESNASSNSAEARIRPISSSNLKIVTEDEASASPPPPVPAVPPAVPEGPPVPTQDTSEKTRKSRKRRQPTEQLPTSSRAQDPPTDDSAKENEKLPIADPTQRVRHTDPTAQLPKIESHEEAEDSDELDLPSIPWHENINVARALLGVWLVLAVVVGIRLLSNAQAAEDARNASTAANSSVEEPLTGLQRWALGETETARVELKKELKYKPRSSRALAGLALIAFDERDFSTAERLFKTLLEVKPKLKRTHWYLGYIAKQAAREQDMKHHWRIFANEYPNSKQTRAMGSAID